jgi:hypothetical protein
MNAVKGKITSGGCLTIALLVAGVAFGGGVGGGGAGGGGGTSLPGRMTGGGSIISNGLRVTHGFNLNCDVTQNPERLEINWNGNRFHLEQLNTAFCSNNPLINPGNPSAAFNTYSGSGAGLYNGVSGATINFVFTDAGEPGVNDFALYTIYDADGNLVLTASGNLDNGNQQAHNP